MPTIVRALDTIVDPHRELADHGWIAGNFYDGCLIDDFSAERLAMVDLDPYHKGPFVNTMGRIFGSTGFMAPEEFRRGAAINERTSVFTLGRVLAVFLSDGSLARGPFRGGDPLYEVMLRACQEGPEGRFPSVAAFAEAWRRAR